MQALLFLFEARPAKCQCCPAGYVFQNGLIIQQRLADQWHLTHWSENKVSKFVIDKRKFSFDINKATIP